MFMRMTRLKIPCGYWQGASRAKSIVTWYWANPEVIKAIQAAVVAQEEQYHRINPERVAFVPF